LRAKLKDIAAELNEFVVADQGAHSGAALSKKAAALPALPARRDRCPARARRSPSHLLVLRLCSSKSECNESEAEP
jgi:hypothetical protein